METRTESRTYQDWANRYGVTMEAEPTDSNHYDCTFRMAGQDGSLTVPFSMYTEPPTIEDVLWAIAFDSSGFENAPSFEDWASEYGYDTDSRTAERTFRAIRKQAQHFRRFLGKTAYEELLLAY